MYFILSSTILLLLLKPTLVLASENNFIPDPLIGKKIYEQGILADGSPVKAVVENDIEIDANQMTCVSCHRRSGYGEGEGGVYIPPITASYLFNEFNPQRSRLFRHLYQDIQSEDVKAKIKTLRRRSAYTDEKLARALLLGINSDGKTLSSPMPRFLLDEQSMQHLIAYMKALAVENDPGVDNKTLHFATIIVSDVKEKRKKAFLSVLEAYIQRKNTHVIHQQKRNNYSLHYKNELLPAYRLWKLHVWQLQGKPQTWQQQLKDYYHNQQVFAVLSGLDRQGETSPHWYTINDFCEQQALPCLFPHTNFPMTDKLNYYSFYFSKGLVGEAEAAASWLNKSTNGFTKTMKVLQVYGDNADGEIMAKAFRKKLKKNHGIVLKDILLEKGKALDEKYLHQLQMNEKPDLIAFWLNEQNVLAFSKLKGKSLLSAGLLNVKNYERFKGMANTIYMTWPWSLPTEQLPRLYRLRSWFRSRRIELFDERMQMNTYFSASVVDHSLMHLVDRFSRDYLLESIEHETENALNPGTYPRMSLGPGQRYAAKGGYIVKLNGKNIIPVSHWIVH